MPRHLKIEPADVAEPWVYPAITSFVLTEAELAHVRDAPEPKEALVRIYRSRSGPK